MTGAYFCRGFARANHKLDFALVIGGRDMSRALEIFGPDIVLMSMSEIDADITVPADVIGVVLPAADFYTALPALAPVVLKRRRRRGTTRGLTEI